MKINPVRVHRNRTKKVPSLQAQSAISGRAEQTFIGFTLVLNIPSASFAEIKEAMPDHEWKLLNYLCKSRESLQEFTQQAISDFLLEFVQLKGLAGTAANAIDWKLRADVPGFAEAQDLRVYEFIRKHRTPPAFRGIV